MTKVSFWYLNRNILFRNADAAAFARIWTVVERWNFGKSQDTQVTDTPWN